MKVKLISYTVPVGELTGIADGVDLINYCATQMPVIKNLKEHFERDDLVKKLIQNQWWEPLELIAMTVEIETNTELAKELYRHKSFTFQKIEHDLEFCIQDIAFFDKSSPNNFRKPTEEESSINEEWKRQQQAVIDLALETWQWAKKHNVPSSLARCVLPTGNTLTKIYMHGNLRRWINFLETRGSPGLHNTQHQAISLACAEVIATVFPNIDTYLNKTLK